MERLTGRSRAADTRWFALALLGVGIAAACSDDSSAPGPNSNPGGAGGEPASSAGKTATAGSTAGSLTTGGSLSNSSGGGAGGQVAGAGGMGGVAPVLPLGQACTACGATECTDTLSSCNDSPACSAWLGCLSACDTGQCVSACDASHAEAARLYANVYDCMCASCEDACTGADVCGKKTCVDDNPLPIAATAPATLAETGLFVVLDGAGGEGAGGAGDVGGAGGAGGAAGGDAELTLAPYVKTFEPKYPLWADGATKQRYIYLPKCSTIDSDDMDHWRFPVGTRFWKTFSVGPTRVETRLMHRFGPGEGDWVFAAYQWNPAKPNDPSAAKYVSDPVDFPDGVANANGTPHDIPSLAACNNCHGKLSEHVLGFGAFQLSHNAAAKDIAIKDISNLGWLTTPAPDGFQVPGNGTEQAALGYLHGNCGGCHNQSQSIPNALNPLVMRLLVGKTDYADTDTVKTTVGVIVSSGLAAITGKPRIAPSAPGNSAILIRMGEPGRGTLLQMPPIATEHEDPTGIAAITAWVNAPP